MTQPERPVETPRTEAELVPDRIITCPHCDEDISLWRAAAAAPPEAPRPDPRLRHLAETIVCFCNDPKLVAEAEELLRELDAARRKHSKVTARVHRSTAKFIKKYRTTLRDLEQSDGSAASPDALRWDGTEYDER